MMDLAKMLAEANEEQLAEFASCILECADDRCVSKLTMELYRMVYGCHFNEWSLKEALSELENEDGSQGPHWTLEQTTSVAKERDIAFGKGFNEYDWCYAMNMVWSDYYKAVTDDVASYARLAKRFLEDRDAPPGKAFRYYVSMR